MMNSEEPKNVSPELCREFPPAGQTGDDNFSPAIALPYILFRVKTCHVLLSNETCWEAKNITDKPKHPPCK
jgi:hypothetical protein